MQRYIAARIVFGLLLLFTVIFLIVRFAGGRDDDFIVEPDEETDTSIVLDEQVDTNSAVKFQIIGETNAKEDHREVLFSIDKNFRKVSIIQGYDGKVIKSIRLTNSKNAYEKLVYALEDEGFLSTRDMEERIADPRGVCSDGKQYHFSLLVDGDEKESRWTSSCSSRSHGTFAGDRRDVEQLFEAQFPEYRDFIKSTRL